MTGVALAVLLTAAPGSAHHSIGGQFDTSKTLTLRGVITRVDWINPHPYVFLDVQESGDRRTWALSTIPLAMLRKAGITKESLAGTSRDIVTVNVHPALNGQPRGWVTRITYPDGRYYALFE